MCIPNGECMISTHPLSSHAFEPYCLLQLQVSLMDVLQEQEEEERVQQVMSLQSAMSQSWAVPADAEQLLFAEVSARAGGMLGDIKDYLQSILSRAEKLVDLANSIPPFTELRNHMEDLTKQFENKVRFLSQDGDSLAASDAVASRYGCCLVVLCM